MNPLHILAAGAGLFYLYIVTLLLLAIRRSAQSRSAWHRTIGRIQSFGVSEDVPMISYSYDVDGRILTGRAFVPGPSAKWSTGIKLPKSLYLHEDGRMRFEPNSEVDVFYNPRNPEDAVLITGVQRGNWVTLVVLTLVAAIVLGLWSSGPQVSDFLSDKQRLKPCLGAFFSLMGMMPFFFGIGYLRRGKRLRGFVKTTGRLLKAEVARTSGEGNAHVPCVAYEYEVEGRLYSSGQWGSIPAYQVGRSRKSVAAQIAALKAEFPLIVHYDPERPWDAFLRHESLAGALFGTALTSVVFWGIGLAIFFSGK